MASTSEVAVFIDSNVGTHIALPLTPHITPSDFKRDLEMTHFNCFPELGKIRIVGFKVKRKSNFYHLPESMLKKYVFQDPRRNQFFSVDVRPLKDLDRPGLAKCETTTMKDQIDNTSLVEDSPDHKSCGTTREKNVTGRKRKWKKMMRQEHQSEAAVYGSKEGNRVEGNPVNASDFGYMGSQSELEDEKKGNLRTLVESPSETSSQAVSVSGIIARYFSVSKMSNIDSPSTSNASCEDIQSKLDDQPRSEKDSRCSSKVASVLTHRTKKTKRKLASPLLKPGFKTPTPKNKLEGPQVGKRLLIASNDLGITKQNPVTSLCRATYGKQLKLYSPPRSLVFEMSDGDNSKS